jgi:hypothetical protein
MDERTADEIKKDFLSWSGGFPPKSDHQIYVYIDAAKPVDVADAELWDLLRIWMNEGESTELDV